jgi:hypothetical protein
MAKRKTEQKKKKFFLARPNYQRAALILNVAGAVILFFAFQANSSVFSLVTGTNPVTGSKMFTICAEGSEMMRTDAGSRMTMIGNAYNTCPADDRNKVALVRSDHPSFAWWGFFTIIIALLVQVFGVPAD